MVGWQTFGWRKYEALDSTMRELIRPLHDAMHEEIGLIDADTNAFDDYMAAMKLPKGTEAEKAARDAAMQEGLRVAIEVPLRTMRAGDACWDAFLGVAQHGNVACLSDMQVGARALEVGIWGAQQNVLINASDVTDDAYRAKAEGEAAEMAERAKTKCEEVLALLEGRK